MNDDWCPCPPLVSVLYRSTFSISYSSTADLYVNFASPSKAGNLMTSPNASMVGDNSTNQRTRRTGPSHSHSDWHESHVLPNNVTQRNGCRGFSTEEHAYWKEKFFTRALKGQFQQSPDIFLFFCEIHVLECFQEFLFPRKYWGFQEHFRSSKNALVF